MEVPPEGELAGVIVVSGSPALTDVLQDGIMNLNGKDYVFARANGDAEW